MSATTKTVLIVGGVAVGAFVLLRMFAPPALAAARPQQSSGGGLGSFIQGITSVLPSIVSAFGSSSYPNAGTYHADTSGFQIQGNQLIDPSTGGALIYGTD